MNAAAFPEGGHMRNAFDVLHKEGHVDRYELGLTINVDGSNITAYRISFSAEHVVPKVGDLKKMVEAEKVELEKGADR